MIALGLGQCPGGAPTVGAWGAVILACSGALSPTSRTPVVKRVFNAAQLVAGSRRRARSSTPSSAVEAIRSDSFPWLLVPFVAAAGGHCAVNGFLVAVIVHLRPGLPFRIIVQGTMVELGARLCRLRAVRAPPRSPLGRGRRGVGPAAALLLLLPLFVARWAYAQYAEEQQAYDRTVRALMAAVETKDLYTRGHSERVSAGSVLIARVIGMREDRVASLRYAGMLHDVGKLGVPDAGPAEERPAHRGRVRGDPAAPHAGPRDRARDRVPRRGDGRDHAPPRAHRRPGLPDGALGQPRSRSSPGSSPWPTRSTR